MVADANERAAVALGEVRGLSAALAAAQARGTVDSRRAAELNAALSHDDVTLRASMTAHVEGVGDIAAALVAERDDLRAKVAERSAAAASADAWRERAENVASLLAALQHEYARVRGDWATSITSAPAVSAALEALRAERAEKVDDAVSSAVGTTLGELRVELEGAKAERDGALSMLESVSAGYEAATAAAARAEESLRAQEAEISRLVGVAARLRSERTSWDTVITASDATAAMSMRAVEEATAALTAERAVSAALREVLALRDERLSAAHRETAVAVARADRPHIGSSLELRMQIVELSTQRDKAVAAAAAASRAATEAEAARRRAEEDANDARRRLARKDEKLVQLRERLLSATASAPTGQLNGILSSASLGSRSSSSLFAGAAATDSAPLGDDKVARLKEEQFTMLRALMECSVCRSNHKDTVITKCFHLFCSECIEKRIKLRDRKCPTCMQGFSEGDVHAVYYG